MGSPTLSFRFALALTFSLTVSPSSSSSSPLPFLFKTPSAVSPKSASSPPPWPSPKSVASDLLSLLGNGRDADRVAPREAGRLRSCLRFLVPFSPTRNPYRLSRKFPDERRDLLAGVCGGGGGDEMVWWPPEPVMELARIAVDSGGDPAAIHRALDPTMLPVPDVEGSKEDRCELTRTPYGRRFINEELNSYFAFLFEMIASRSPLVGFNVSLNCYDLFHGHIFLATNSGRLGILFHAREYPAFEKKIFPFSMGYCQTGSNVMYDNSINLRNILWLAPLPSNVTKAWLAPGVLVILDAHPEGIIYKDLVPEYVDYVRTIYEDDFGDIVADVNYLDVNNVAPGERIFIC